jgi:putative acyl-CoA dehydrogenase
MAHALQAAEMLQHGDADAADLFVRSRLGMEGMHVFGALPSSESLSQIVARATVIQH